jgi:hypothetical protein
MRNRGRPRRCHSERSADWRPSQPRDLRNEPGSLDRTEGGVSLHPGRRCSRVSISGVCCQQETSADAERHLAWVLTGRDALRPCSFGVYVKFLSDEGAEGVELANSDRLKRLGAFEDRFDPTNVVRMNANVPPTGWSSRPGPSSARASGTIVVGRRS